MNEETFDCTGFNFHCPENKSYIFFDPQTQQENDRLDTLLGATKLWNASIEKHRNEIPSSEKGFISPFTELKPVGWTTRGGITEGGRHLCGARRDGLLATARGGRRTRPPKQKLQRGHAAPC
jgi:hypothetical protein